MNFKRSLERTLFGSRYILILFYFGLIIALICYGFVFAKQTYHMVSNIGDLTSESVMLAALELIDTVMIANLVKLIITGSYHAFVSKDHEYKDEKASSGLLKVKMSTSLIGVTAIHLLQSFIAINNVAWDTLLKQLAIHATFLIGALILAVIEFLHEKGEYFSELVITHEEEEEEEEQLEDEKIEEVNEEEFSDEFNAEIETTESDFSESETSGEGGGSDGSGDGSGDGGE